MNKIKKVYLFIFIGVIILLIIAFFAGMKFGLYNRMALKKSTYYVAPESIYVNLYSPREDSLYTFSDKEILSILHRNYFWVLGMLTEDALIEQIKDKDLKQFLKDQQSYRQNILDTISTIREDQPNLKL